MRKIRQVTTFKKDIKRISKRKKDITKLYSIIEKLLKGQSLDTKNLAHRLTGNYSDKWECHIEPDWLRIYKIIDDTLILYRTGSHADLFA